MTNNPTAHHRYLADDDEHEAYAPVGLDGLLASTEKLLAINRGIAEPDARDSLPNDRIFTVDRLMGERIKLDHGRTLRSMMGRLSRAKSLKPFGANAFGDYTAGYIKSNPLVPALEGINPMHNLEQKRRITKMGPGGIGDPNAITEDMQCHDGATEVMTREGWKFWPEVTRGDMLACRVGGVLEFHKPDTLHSCHYEGLMHGVASTRFDYLVTPNHRFWSSGDSRTPESSWKWESAEQQEGKYRCHTCVSEPYSGSDVSDTFTLETAHPETGGRPTKDWGEIDMGDWCEFLGWYMSEGSCSRGSRAVKEHYRVIITQSQSANPDNVIRVRQLLDRLPWGSSFQSGKNFTMCSKSLHQFLSPFGKSYEKRVPPFVMEVKPEHRARFLEAYMLGDGWVQKSGSRVFSTSSKSMADDLEMLVAMAGRPVTRGTPWMGKKRDGSDSRLIYRVNSLTSDYAYVKPHQNRLVEFSGPVFCATVAGGLLLTRRGATSKPIWTGNSVDASQFAFVDPIAGPESNDRETLIFSSLGWIPAPEVTMKHRLACNIDGRLEFHHPEKVHSYPFKGELVGVKTKFVDFLVTPTHRVWSRDTDKRNTRGRHWQMRFAEDVYGRAVNFEMAHDPMLTTGSETFTGIPGCEFPMGPWCKFLAYWMADGSCFERGHQSRIAHSRVRPAYEGICEVLDILGLDWKYVDTPLRSAGSEFPTGDFVISHPGVTKYLRQFGKAGTKYLPDYVLQQRVEVKEAVWQALMETDSRCNDSHTSFVSTSKRFARVVERLLVSLGHPASFREEPDRRDHVKSTNWVVSKLKLRSRQARTPSHNGWYKKPYDDDVFCVTVPGGMIFTRRGDGYGHWTGNSEKAGIDVRLSHGARIGSDGRIYQLLLNRKTGKKQWASPSDLRGKTLKLPD